MFVVGIICYFFKFWFVYFVFNINSKNGYVFLFSEFRLFFGVLRVFGDFIGYYDGNFNGIWVGYFFLEVILFDKFDGFRGMSNVCSIVNFFDLFFEFCIGFFGI